MNERKEYLSFLPVSSEKMAALLKNRVVWKTLTQIRKTGCRGIMPADIAEVIEEADSTVYDALESLDREGYLRSKKRRQLKPEQVKKLVIVKERDRREMKLTRPGKSPIVYFEPCDFRAALEYNPERHPENPWGDVIFSRAFWRKIRPVVDDYYRKVPGLKEIIIDHVRKLHHRLKRNNMSKSYMPSEEKCPFCHRSHEGVEYIKALVLSIAAMVLDSDECGRLLVELNLAEPRKK